MSTSPAALAAALQSSIETGDPTTARRILHPTRYRQHNPGIADGMDAILAIHDQLPHDDTFAHVVRCVQDGDHAVVHVDYHLFEPTVAFDVHRFEGERSVEHWDNLQPTPPGRNASRRTMTDGKTQVVDRHLTDENKELARRFTQEVLVDGAEDHVGEFFDGDRLAQHSPHVGDGVTAWLDLRRRWTTEGRATRHEAVRKVLGEGSFVLVMSEGRFRGEHAAYFDLYRLRGGWIVEHWDVVEAIPPESERRNANGKF